MILVFILLVLLSAASSLRLSKEVIPSKQLLDLTFHFDTWTYDGRTEIDIKVKKARNSVWLYASKTLKIKGVTLRDGKSKPVAIDKVLVDHKKKILFVKAKATIKPGNYKLKIGFTGNISESLQGLLRTGYVDCNGRKHLQVSTHFEPDKAREAFPCFDEPSYRIKIKLIVTHPATHRCNSAAPVLKTTRLGGRYVRTEFKETGSMSIYLLAINIHDMDQVTLKSKSGVPVTVLTPTQHKEKAKITGKLAADAIDFFEKYLGSKYPFPKLDIQGIYDFNAGGMENIGMIHLLYDCAYAAEDTLGVGSYLYCRTVIVHEVSHMWFGNLVSLKWWDDLWLKEGFARFITAYAQDNMKTDRLPGAHLLHLVKRGYMSGIDADKFKFTKPVRQKLLDSYGAAAMFNGLSYAKSAWILRGIMKLIGESSFQKGLRKYFKTYPYKSADFNDFTACFANITKKRSARSFMENWLNEPGFPVIKLKKDGDKKVAVTQSRFTPSGNYKTKQVWFVPLNFKSDTTKATDYKLWDSKKTTHKFSKDPNWYLADTENAGFVIFQYDKANVLQIAKELYKNHTILTDTQRMIWVINLIENFNNGKLSSKELLETSRYVGKETSADILTSWVRVLLAFRSNFFLAENTYLFNKYIKHLLKPHVDSLMKHEIRDVKTWNKRKSYQYLFYFGVKWRNPVVIQRAKRIIRKFFRGEHVDAVFLRFAMRYYIRSKGWYALFRRLHTYPRSLHEYVLIAYVLSKTRNPRQQQFLLRYTMTNKRAPRSLSRKTVCHIARVNPPLAWEWLKDNYAFYFKMFGEAQFSMSRLLECATENLTTQEQYNDVRDFFETHPTGTGKSGLKRGLKSISENIKAKRRASSGSVNRTEDYDEVFQNFVKGIGDDELAS